MRDFLASRRGKLSPQQAGVPRYGDRRRVPGLRREEVAQLAGLSTDYYTRLEKGNLGSASESVLEAIARALQLDDAERAHLLDLARTARGGTPPRRRSQPQQLRPSVQHVLDAMTTAPAFVNNGRLDLVGVNALGRALYTEVLDSPAGPANFARYCFFDPRSREFYTDWDAPPTPRPTCCAPKPVATRTAARCTTWSASSRPAARSSACAGRATTSTSTSRGARPSATPSSVSCSWPSTPSRCPPTPVWR